MSVKAYVANGQEKINTIAKAKVFSCYDCKKELDVIPGGKCYRNGVLSREIDTVFKCPACGSKFNVEIIYSRVIDVEIKIDFSLKDK